MWITGWGTACEACAQDQLQVAELEGGSELAGKGQQLVGLAKRASWKDKPY